MTLHRPDLRPHLRIHYRMALAFALAVVAAVAGNYVLVALVGDRPRFQPMRYPSAECRLRHDGWAVCAYEGRVKW